jgi:hypothetical protein
MSDDTFERSCEHWSEAGRPRWRPSMPWRRSTTATLPRPWTGRRWLQARQQRAGDRPLRLLDVACGSGKFPSALFGTPTSPRRDPTHRLRAARPRGVLRRRGPPRAGAALRPGPGVCLDAAGARLPARGLRYRLGHACPLCLPPSEELQAGLERFVQATGDIGFIAHASADAHYLRFYRHYLDAFRDGQGTPYTTPSRSSRRCGKWVRPVETLEINYENGAPSAQQATGRRLFAALRVR